ncbi:MAG: hypothetical protein A2496_08095 [Burkholderiales bacterium RIFOXYC12_FULL_60_6]|nr:MAG: hypothetical protein A2496_08095 [Burkholderiales bacterium RIFOXYC12_FULL_60_6]
MSNRSLLFLVTLLAGAAAGCASDLCGNGKLDGDEACDGAALNDQTCRSAGFSYGTVACDSSCALDTRACVMDPCWRYPCDSTGTAIGEGSAVAFNDDINAKLNAIYGVDVSTAQKALLAVRVSSAILGAAGEKAVEAAEAIGQQLDETLNEAAHQALLKSGGVVDPHTGEPILDLKQLTTEQKGAFGELFGENLVKQIVPDGQKLARSPGIGETGIDDLYKVNRPDVDYVHIEYKFVGNETTKGSSRLGDTQDGKQGSESWMLGSGRLAKAVGEENAIAVEKAVKAGRAETWVVTTRPGGATEIEVLDAFGKPKPIDTSKILPGIDLSRGVQP